MLSREQINEAIFEAYRHLPKRINLYFFTTKEDKICITERILRDLISITNNHFIYRVGITLPYKGEIKEICLYKEKGDGSWDFQLYKRWE